MMTCEWLGCTDASEFSVQVWAPCGETSVILTGRALCRQHVQPFVDVHLKAGFGIVKARLEWSRIQDSLADLKAKAARRRQEMTE